MLVGYYLAGPFGQAAAEEDLFSLVRRLIEPPRPRASSGLGAVTVASEAGSDQYVQWYETGKPFDVYRDPLVECQKDKSGSPVCFLRAFPRGPRAQSGPIADMQAATDGLLAKIPVYNLQGQRLKVVVANPQGGTVEAEKTIPAYVPPNPVLIESGGTRYDGILGPRTMEWVAIAAIVAGMLKDPPATANTPLVVPHRRDLIAEQAAGIAAYFRDVAANFDTLLKAYKARGNQPAASLLEPGSIPNIILPEAARAEAAPMPRKFPTAPVVATAAAMAGIVGIAVWAATRPKKKTEMVLPRTMF